ncbi:MAG: conjugal transfer protein TraX, partial [Lachnospiraceae bacterium]|nr:conjugal transfer protein TraX [Lachnospiraceae bacterium]
ATLILWHNFRDYIVTLDYDAIMRYEKIYHAGRSIGRLAFPIFCFLLTEGFFHTKSRPKYLLRLMVMALVSEHAFNLLVSGTNLDPYDQNVFLTLAISLITIMLIDKVKDRFTGKPDIVSVLTIVITGLGCLLAYKLNTDYDYKGVLAVTVMYLLHGSRILTCLGTALAFTWEPWAITAAGPILLYNGKRGLSIKYFFYIFYPLHIYLIYYIARAVSPF